MPIKAGLELNNDGRAIAWALDYPGCFAYGKEGPEAIAALPQAAAAYQEWANRRGGEGWLDLGDYDLRLVETWEDYFINEAYEPDPNGYGVEAFFREEWKPLTAPEIARGIQLLSWSRVDLLHAVGGLSAAEMDVKKPLERWSIRGILNHVSGAEWWYMDRLDLVSGPRDALPEDVFEPLSFVRAALNAALPKLAGKELVIGKNGEIWSPRKLLRRSAWHELDHVGHILKLI